MAKEPYPSWSPTPPQIRGTVLSASIDWIRRDYGEATYRRILERLPEADRQRLRGSVSSLAWYPIDMVDRFGEASRLEVQKITGEDEESYHERSQQEGGGKVLKTLYKFLFSLLRPSNTIARMPLLVDRIYDQARCEVLENREGYARIHYFGSPAMYQHFKQGYRRGLLHTLSLAGAKDVEVKETRDDWSPRGYSIEVEIRYR